MGKMESIISVILIALLATTVLCVPEGRLKRSYDNAQGRGDQTDYGIDSDERDASVEDFPSCRRLEDNSGSLEHGFDYDQPPGQESRRGFSVKAAAAASSSSFS